MEVLSVDEQSGNCSVADKYIVGLIEVELTILFGAIRIWIVFCVALVYYPQMSMNFLL